MKKIFTILTFFSSLCIFSQGKVAEKVTKLQKEKSVFHHFSVLTATAETPSRAINKVVSKATFAKINNQQVNAIVANKYETIEVEIPYQGATVLVELYKVDLFNETFHVDTDKRTNIAYEKGVYYRGMVKDDLNSVVGLNFFQNEMNGVISNDAFSNLVIGKLDKANNTTDYIVYSDANMNVLSGFNCHTKEDSSHSELPSSDETSRSVNSTRCVTMYFEIDYNLYQNNNSNVTTTTNWITSVFNNIQTLYENDDISVALKSLYIWTTSDPYTGASSADYLYQFNSVRPVFDGDVGQLVGIDPNDLGGVAVTINGLCSGNNFSYTDANFSYATVPTYSWTIEAMTHEFGHLLGSRHTHACVWNGNNTSIDGCGTQAGYAEGTCALGPIPSSATKGTIMSYCHLISGVGISFNNGFGPQPKLAILAAVNGGTCLSTDCVNTCINTVTGITATNITNNSVTVNWTETGSATSWQVAVTAFNSVLINWVTVTSPTYTVSNLNTNAYYKIRVRPVCSAGLVSSSREQGFATTANWCNGVTITDTGGAGDYGDMESYVRTIIPTVANKKIVLTFTVFDLELDYDYLYLYDGPNTTFPDLSNGGFTGSTLPGTFTSTAADGSLTLRFSSDPLVEGDGYSATVNCQDMLGVADHANIDFTYYPNPTNGVVSITSKTPMSEVTVYNITGQLLFTKKINAMDTQVDIAAFATGTYFFKLKFDGIETNFKILKM